MDVALALGGGGVKGISHIGVLSWLESHGFRVRAVAGTSIGGLVGSVYAAGNSPLEILKIVQRLDFTSMYRRRPEDGPSLMGHAGLVEAIAPLLKDKNFSDLRIPFACTAVDINSAREFFFSGGPVLDAVLATMAIPGILPPVQMDGVLLVDGAVLDPVPVLLARHLAPKLPIIAVALSPAMEDWDKVPQTSPLPIPSVLQGLTRLRIGQALRIFTQSLDINSYMLSELRLKSDRPDVIIRPQVYQIGILEFTEPLDLVQAGIEAAEAARPKIEAALSPIGKLRRSIRRYPEPEHVVYFDQPQPSPAQLPAHEA